MNTDEKTLISKTDSLLSDILSKTQMNQKALKDSQRWTEPVPVIVNGHPLVDTVLRDGTFVYVAADHNGEPMKDDEDKYVVIDPRTKALRYRVKKAARSFAPEAILGGRTDGFVQNPNRLPMADTNGLLRAIEGFNNPASYSPEFLQAVSSIKAPHIETESKISRKSSLRKFGLILKAIGIVIKLFVLTKILRRPQPAVTGKVVYDLATLSKYLNTNAKALLLNHIDTSLYVGVAGKFAIPRTIAMSFRSTIVHRLRDNTNPFHKKTIVGDMCLGEEYVRRWANMLNDLADKGIWVYGTHKEPALLMNAVYDLSSTAVVFATIYTPLMAEDDSMDPDSAINALNNKVGYKLFQSADRFDISFDWSTFPW